MGQRAEGRENGDWRTEHGRRRGERARGRLYDYTTLRGYDWETRGLEDWYFIFLFSPTLSYLITHNS